MTQIATHQLTLLRENGERLNLPGLPQFLHENLEQMEWHVRSSKAYLAINPHGATFQQCVALTDLFEDRGLEETDASVVSLHELEVEIHANGTVLIGLDADSIIRNSQGWSLGGERPVDDLQTAVQIVLAKRRT